MMFYAKYVHELGLEGEAIFVPPHSLSLLLSAIRTINVDYIALMLPAVSQ